MAVLTQAMKMKLDNFPARSNRGLLWSRNGFLIFGVIALGYVGYTLLDSRLYQADQARQFDQVLKDANLERVESLGSAAREGSALGRIEIRPIGLTVMILEGTSEETLQRAVGHIQGTSLPGQSGNVAIAGHRDTFFRGLRKIRLGDEILLTTLNEMCIRDSC